MHRTKTTAMRRTKITALIALSSVSALVFAFSLTSPAGGETGAAAAGNSQSHPTTAVPISAPNAVSDATNSNGSYNDLVALQAAPSPCNTYSYTVSTGTIVSGTTDTGNHTDDDSTLIALPFSYQLYDSTFDTVVVGSNGHLTFGTVNDDWDLTCIPVVISTYAIGPYWTDLCTGACDNVSGQNLGIFTSTSGSAPNRIFNIEWRAAYYNSNQTTNIPLNFEVRLYEGLGQFDVVYGAMQPSFTPPDVRTLTVGVQQSDTSVNTLVGCDTSGGVNPPVSSGQLYHFVNEACSYTVIYDGNGNTGGSAPVDPNSPYNAGSLVGVLGPGSLINTGNMFTGWNTLANGMTGLKEKLRIRRYNRSSSGSIGVGGP